MKTFARILVLTAVVTGTICAAAHAGPGGKPSASQRQVPAQFAKQRSVPAQQLVPSQRPFSTQQQLATQRLVPNQRQSPAQYVPVQRQQNVEQKLNPGGAGVVPRLGFVGIHTDRLSEPVTEGMYVLRVNPNSLAERIGLEAGDVILKINDQRIRCSADYDRALLNARLRGGNVTMMVDDVRYNYYTPTKVRFNLDW